ncbi:MFS transporter [Microbacterium sp. Marseille-Q6965]|uniref:MFS transporter n=1 Tax=Microbacterium sp. Marseille-Q6965 TaxID=2965072 RepID=UPI0021B79BFF|nr:MFS transporter [Microbacterium sp. Marseille-Q6965]
MTRPGADDDRWRGVAGGAMLIGVAVMAAIYAPQPLLAEIAAEFGRSALEANLVVSMTTLGIACGVFPAAWIAERAGRGPVLMVSLACGAVLTVVTAATPQWTVLVVARFLAGLLMSGVLVSAVVWTGAAVPRVRRARVAAAYVSGTTVGGMSGRILAGVAAEAWGWRAGILVVDALVVLGGAAGVAAVVALARRRRAAVPAVTGGIPVVGGWTLRARLYAIAFLAMASFIGVYNAVAFRMAEPPFSLGVGLTSLLFLGYIAGTVSSARAGAVLDRIGVRATILAGVVLELAGILVTLVDSLLAVVPGLLLMAAGFFVLHAAASATVPAVSPRPTVGSAWYTLWYYAGSSAGSLLLGAAWDAGRWPAVAGLAGAMSVLAAGAAATLPDRPAMR